MSHPQRREFVGVVIYNDSVRVSGHTLALPKRPRHDTSEGLSELRQEPARSSVKRRKLFSHVEISTRHESKSTFKYDMHSANEPVNLDASFARRDRRNKPRVCYKEDQRLDTQESEDDFDFPADSDEESTFTGGTDSACDTALSSISEASSQSANVTDDDDDDEDPAPWPRGRSKKKRAKEEPTQSIKTKETRPPESLKRQSTKGLDLTLPPIFKIDDIFLHLTDKALPLGLRDALKQLGHKVLRVATMCSGTESPMLALNMIAKALPKPLQLEVEHVFSAEIVDFKQAYIYRNFAPKLLFRDIHEFSAIDIEETGATTVWGSKEHLPGDVDLLVAGFSCKDRSSMNNKRKDIEGDGETADTLNGILAYARMKRPPVVILENVKGDSNDWIYVGKKWAEIDYDMTWTMVDTKKYYIPHTRQRTYLLCLDKRALPVDTGESLHSWKQLMKQLERPASSSIEAFMLPDDDPRARYNQRSNLSQGESSWPKCAQRHRVMRDRMQLGQGKPLTQPRIPDFADHAWHSTQAKRVLDFLDMSHLRNARPERGSYDDSYKLRCWMPSQNVDHQVGEDKQGFGIAPCITPRTIPYNSTRGAVVSGLEALALQGIPIDDVLTIETDKDLADLAGNAMTSTVVGAAILSALIVALPNMEVILESGSRPEVDTNKADTRPRIRGIEKLVQTASSLGFDEHSFVMKELLDDAITSSAMCSCEKQGEVKSYIQVCKRCGHSACTDCLGNPRHEYVKSTQERGHPADFVAKWKPKLPLCLSFSNAQESSKYLKHVSFTKTSYKDQYSALVRQLYEQVFVMDKFRRSARHWSVTYESPGGSLILSLGVKPSWLLYLRCPADLPVENELRRIISQPIAQSNGLPTFLCDIWSHFIPRQEKISLSVKASTSSGPSWRARMGFPDFLNETVPISLDITVSKDASETIKLLNGTYNHLPECGTASQILYQQIDTNYPLYLFLDPSLTGDPDKDSMLFSYEHRRLMIDESRMPIVRLDPKFRPWNFSAASATQSVTLTGSTEGFWSLNKSLTLNHKQLTANALVPSSFTKWLDGFKANDCGKLTAILCCEVEVHKAVEGELLNCRSQVSEQELLLTRFLSFAQHRQGDVKLGSWQDMEVDPELCPKCEPRKPAVTWAVSREKNQTRIRWVELAERAATYERAMAQRPLAHSIQTKLLGDGKCRVSVACDAANLLHRALARFQARNGTERAQCRLLTRPPLGKIYERKRFALKDNSHDKSYNVPLANEERLHEDQRRSLHWMRQRESKKSSILIEEVEEETLLRLDWRLEVKVTREVGLRGGCLADTVSYGKTVLSLSLIHAEYLEKSAKEIERENVKMSGDLINVSASLVICQRQLCNQWETEIKKFLPASYESGVLVIRGYKDLQKLSILDIRKAKIVVLSWSVLADQGYLEALGSFVGLPTPEGNGKHAYGRLYAHWIQCCAERIPQCLKDLRREGLTTFFGQEAQRLEDNLKKPEFEGILPQKYYTGQKYVQMRRLVEEAMAKGQQKAPAFKKKINTNRASNQDLDSWGSFTGPPMHLFAFNRIIVDEWSYLEEGTSKDKNHPILYPSIKHLVAPKKWVLSGTPALEDFIDVKRMASLLGVDLGIDDYTPDVVAKRNLEASRKSQTKLEQFETYRKSRSVDWHNDRDAAAQRFLNECVRRNAARLGSIQCCEQLKPTIPLSGQRVLYDELAAYLLIQNVKRPNAKTDPSDRAASIRNFWHPEPHSKKYEEALINASNESTTLRSLTEIHDVRANQIKDLTMYLKRVLTRIKSLPEVQKDSQWLKQVEANVEVKALYEKVIAGPPRSSNDETLGTLTQEVRTTASQLQVMKDALRFTEQVGRIEAGNSTECANDDCIFDATAVLPLCGHAFCEECFEGVRHATICGIDGCELVPSFATREIDFTQAKEKSAALIELIKSTPKADQVLIFAPGQDAVKLVRQTLRANHIPCFAVVKSEERTVDNLRVFQEDKNTETMKKALILNVGDESAAGSNLTNANHVIFISPHLDTTQKKYDNAMEQAIGRVRRYNQEKKVFIYRFVALGTIEVDILQLREHRNSVLRENVYKDPVPTTDTERENDEADLVSTTDTPRELTQLVMSEKGEMALVPKSWVKNGEVSHRLKNFKISENYADSLFVSAGGHQFDKSYLI